MNIAASSCEPKPFAVSSDASVCAAADEILEVGVVDDDPVEAVLVALALDLRARRLRDRVRQLVDVVERAPELAGRLRLERDRGRAGRLQPELGLERDRRGRQHEELVVLRLGELLAPEEDVPETQVLRDRAAHLAGDLRERRDPLLERRVIHEELAEGRLRPAPG